MQLLDIPETILSCPNILETVILPNPDADGKYSATEIDSLTLRLYETGSVCSNNLQAVKKTYDEASKTGPN